MRTGFNRLLCMALCTPRLPNLSKCKQNRVHLFGFSPVAFLISNRFRFWVIIEWIYCTVTFFIAHCSMNAIVTLQSYQWIQWTVPYTTMPWQQFYYSSPRQSHWLLTQCGYDYPNSAFWWRAGLKRTVFILFDNAVSRMGYESNIKTV